MIIPLYTEDEILRELLDDYKSVERKAKNIALKEIEKMKKTGSDREPKYISERGYGSLVVRRNAVSNET